VAVQLKPDQIKIDHDQGPEKRHRESGMHHIRAEYCVYWAEKERIHLSEQSIKAGPASNREWGFNYTRSPLSCNELQRGLISGFVRRADQAE
jgi:hypothetical protein